MEKGTFALTTSSGFLSGGGSNQYEGRVEVCINDQWGTVCSDFWSGLDATIVCKQLGYSYTGSELMDTYTNQPSYT